MAKQDRPQQQQTREHPARPTVDKQATQVVSRPVPRTERSIETQAQSLGDRRASSAQRQAMALRMGRTQGNRHVQRVVSSMPSHKPTAARTPTARPAGERTPEQVPEGMGSSGAPSMAGAWPPDSPSSRYLYHSPGTPSSPVVQLDLIDDARAAARGLLNRLIGQADNEGRQIEDESSAGVTEVDRDSRAQGTQFQTGAQAQGTQLEAMASQEQSALESQAETQGAQLEAQAAAAETTLQGQWSGVEAQANASASELEGQATGQAAELTGEAQGIAGQATERWNTREGETTSEMSALERVARGLYSTTQERARQLLDSEQEQDLDSAAQSIEGGWLELLSRIAPFQQRLSQMWDTLSRWFRGLLQPLAQRLRQFSQWVTRQVAALARHIRALWSRVTQFARRIRDTIQNLANRARQFVGRVVSAAMDRVRSGAQRILGTVRQSAARLGSFVRRTAQRLVSRLRQHTQRAIDWVQRGISRLASLFARAAGRVLSGLRGVAGPALSRLTGSAERAVTWVRDVGQSALDGLRAVGSHVTSIVRVAGTWVLGVVTTAGQTALNGLGAAWSVIERAWQGLRERLSGLFDRVREWAGALADRIRDQLLRPVWDEITSRWQALRENVRFGLGRLLRGWQRLVAWGRSARARARSEDPQVQDAVLGEARQRAEAPFESVFYKRQPGVRRGDGQGHVAGRLHVDGGQPLETSVRARMESAFGHSFGGVRVHRGTDAARATQDAGARALTMGTEVAFAQGEYQPGTPIGDALIAHELAHVIQQESPGTAQQSPAQEGEIETDADRSAIGAVAALWTGAKDAAGRIAQDALPRLRSGLRLSSCRRGFPEGVAKPKVTFSPVHVGPKLPNDIHRIPPRTGTDVSVQIDGWQDIMPPIVISAISERGGRNTPISINGEQEAEIAADGAQQVNVFSKEQPPTSQSYQLIAKCGDWMVGQGQTFNIAAHPSGVTFSFQEVMRGKAHEGKQYWGAIYGLTIDSDSGNREDLGLVEATEIIRKDNPTGFFAQIPLQRSGFRPALAPYPDHHGVSFGSSAAFKSIIDTDAGATGTQIQYLRFAGGGAAIERNYQNGPIIPNSGFKISLKVTKEKGRYYLHVSKEGFANNGASAGTVTGEPSPIEVK